jgi:hypothetical protein
MQTTNRQSCPSKLYVKNIRPNYSPPPPTAHRPPQLSTATVPAFALQLETISAAMAKLPKTHLSKISYWHLSEDQDIIC